jgi:hypothetical protein
MRLAAIRAWVEEVESANRMLATHLLGLERDLLDRDYSGWVFE